jgi:hypothetical protein
MANFHLLVTKYTSRGRPYRVLPDPDRLRKVGAEEAPLAAGGELAHPFRNLGNLSTGVAWCLAPGRFGAPAPIRASMLACKQTPRREEEDGQGFVRREAQADDTGCLRPRGQHLEDSPPVRHKPQHPPRAHKPGRPRSLRKMEGRRSGGRLQAEGLGVGSLDPDGAILTRDRISPTGDRDGLSSLSVLYVGAC